VEERDHPAPGGRLPDRVEARIVGCERLVLGVHLEPLQAESVHADDLDGGVFQIRMHRPETDDALARCARHPVVDRGDLGRLRCHRLDDGGGHAGAVHRREQA
jgi:hypothetical protein